MRLWFGTCGALGNALCALCRVQENTELPHGHSPVLCPLPLQFQPFVGEMAQDAGWALWVTCGNIWDFWKQHTGLGWEHCGHGMVTCSCSNYCNYRTGHVALSLPGLLAL